MNHADLYYLAFPNDRVYMKGLVYGIYILEVTQTVLIIETGFRHFVTGFGVVEVFDRVEVLWLSIPIFTAIGKVLLWPRADRSYIPPSYIPCSDILCAPDQDFGTIEESCRNNRRCKLLKYLYCT